MKKIKINFCGIPTAGIEEMYFVKLLRERYDVEISEDPDYLFCGIGSRYAYTGFKGIRIFYALECFYPDMNVFDYAFSCTDLGENERHSFIFLPIYNEDVFKNWEIQEPIKTKTKFCNYIYSHGGMKERTKIFDVINTYKRVDAAGKWLNNMNGETVGANNTDWNSKLEFQSSYKFSIAVENFSYPYYCTEKITDAFRAHTIPIYYGDPHISEYFNEKSFINLHSYETFEDALEVIKELDQDEEKYLQMLNEQKFVNENFLEEQKNKLKNFLYNIFDQEYEDAFRRPMEFWPKKHEIQLKMSDFMFEEKKEKKNFSQFFKENNIKKVAVYGQGEFYNAIKEALLTSDVLVKCIIETYKPNVSKNSDNIDIVWACSVEDYEDVDAIIVTPSYVMDEICVMMERLGISKRLIPIEELI